MNGSKGNVAFDDNVYLYEQAQKLAKKTPEQVNKQISEGAANNISSQALKQQRDASYSKISAAAAANESAKYNISSNTSGSASSGSASSGSSSSRGITKTSSGGSGSSYGSHASGSSESVTNTSSSGSSGSSYGGYASESGYGETASGSTSVTKTSSIDGSSLKTTDHITRRTGGTSSSSASSVGSTSDVSVNAGVAVTATAASAATTGSSVQISANVSELEANVKKISSLIENLDNIWNDIKTNQINAISNSWAGAPAKAYTDKVLNMESKINNAKNALSLISTTYSKAINEINSKQDELMSKINS